MRFELFVASRYLFAKRKQAFIYLISLMSILGVAIGVAALIIVLGVYNGFTNDIQSKIIGANAHIIVTGIFNTPLLQQDSVPQHNTIQENIEHILTKIRQTTGVKAATPFVYAETMLSSTHGVKGIILRGVEPSTALDVIPILSNLKEGHVDSLNNANSNTYALIIGSELAHRLGLTVNSRVNLLSPSGQKTTSGFQPRIKPFVISGVFHTGMFEYDSSLAFTSIPAAQNILGLPSDFISGIEVTINDAYAAKNIAVTIQKILGKNFSVKSWMEMNANLFAALRLEKIGMFIILTMVVLIGSFSIVTTLIMLVMEKTRDIAILLSMGATPKMIRTIFIAQGTIIGIIGTSLGYILGISLALLLQQYQFIKLPPGVYTIDHLPVLLNWLDIFIIGAFAMLLCFLATLYPAQQASKLQPVEGLRYE